MDKNDPIYKPLKLGSRILKKLETKLKIYQNISYKTDKWPRKKDMILKSLPKKVLKENLTKRLEKHFNPKENSTRRQESHLQLEEEIEKAVHHLKEKELWVQHPKGRKFRKRDLEKFQECKIVTRKIVNVDQFVSILFN